MKKLLWTGGWDSTFRLLQLAHSGNIIQPHYIRDTKRDSLKKELKTMDEIRTKVNKSFPESFVREIEVINQTDIIEYPEFSLAYKNLLSKGWLGSQYVHIASYCKQKQVKGMELSIERARDKSRVRFTNIPCLENTEIDSDGNRVISKRSDEDLLCLYGQFSFPILSLTKLDMLEESKKLGFADLLNITWFCHQPLFGKPCGSCNPCMSTLEEGLEYRFSTLSRTNYRLKKMIISNKKLHRFLKRLKYGVNDYSSR
ncbi:MAG: hypothetical protein HLX50_17785 [Alteromonadaceae bacterium]|nr:hypothetical protein [Alteromonadaceae bacterium]